MPTLDFKINIGLRLSKILKRKKKKMTAMPRLMKKVINHDGKIFKRGATFIPESRVMKYLDKKNPLVFSLENTPCFNFFFQVMLDLCKVF